VAAPRPDVLATVEAVYRQHFEVPPARASISFLGVEQIEVLRYSEGAADHYVSLGMSRYPMTDPTAAIVDESSAPRAELFVTVVGAAEHLWRNLAILAAAPAVEGAIYAVGNRVDLGTALCAGSRCTGGVLGPGPLPAIAVPGLVDVEILQLLPATATELAWARVHGSEALQERWRSAGTTLTDLARDPVVLA
jgi:hypothetical protein